MGLLTNEQGAAPQAQPKDDNTFNMFLQNMYQNYSNEDPIDRSSRLAATRQQDAYLANKNEWDKILQSGGDLPNINKPVSFDPAEAAKIDQMWNDKISKSYSLDTGNKDANGNPIMENVSFRPWKTYYGQEEVPMNDDYFQKLKKGYEQHGMDFLNFIFK